MYNYKENKENIVIENVFDLPKTFSICHYNLFHHICQMKQATLKKLPKNLVSQSTVFESLKDYSDVSLKLKLR
jgi:hypothetical protein